MINISCQPMNNYSVVAVQLRLSKRMLVTFRAGWIFAWLPGFPNITLVRFWLVSRFKACLDIFNLELHLFILSNNPTKIWLQITMPYKPKTLVWCDCSISNDEIHHYMQLDVKVTWLITKEDMRIHGELTVCLTPFGTLHT